MRKQLLLPFFLFLAVTIVSACAAETMVKEEAGPAGVIGAAGEESAKTPVSDGSTFVIAGMMHTTETGQFAKEYQDQTAVEIIVDTCQNGLPGEYEKYIEQLATQLMAGTAPDVFYLPEPLYFDYSVSPYVYDINNFFDTDPAVERSDYYENILDAFEVQGKLPVWPSSISGIPFVGIHENMRDIINPAFFQKDTITYKEMLGYYYGLDQGIREENPLYEHFNPVATLLLSDDNDFKNRQFNFNNKEYVKLLEMAKEATNPRAGDYAGFAYGIQGNEMKEYKFIFNTPNISQKDIFLPPKAEYSYIFDNGVNPPFLEGPSGMFTDYRPLTDENGNLIITYSGFFAVNANSPHLDLAWEFLKFSATENVVPFILKTHDIMLEKELNERYMYEDLEYFVKAGIIGTALPSQDQRDAITLTDEQLTDIEETAKWLLQWCESPMTLRISQIPEVVDILVDYRNDKITASQAAALMQNKIELMILE